MKDAILWEEKNSIEPKMKLENNQTFVPNDITSEIKKNVIEKPCEDIGKISGIYKIINKINGKYYVGSSINIKTRWINHKTLLNHNKHNNIHLQNAWNKYGRDNFEITIEEIVEKNNLLDAEQKYIDICNNNRNISYNITRHSTSPMKDRKMSDETKKKMSNSHKGYIFTEEHKRNLSKSKKGINHHFYDKRPPNFGKKLSEAHRRKLSEIKKGKPSPMKGKEFSEKAKLNMSISAIGKRTGQNNGMYGNGHIISGKNHPMFGKHFSEETRLKMSISAKNRNKFKNTNNN